MGIKSDGKIDAAGYVKYSPNDIAVVRYNANGDIDRSLIDALLSLQFSCDLPTDDEVKEYADVNADGRIGLVEAVFVLQELAEFR